MSFRILPQGPQDPVRTAVGGVQGRVEPVRDFGGQQMQQLGQGLQTAAVGVTRLADTLQDDLDVAKSADFEGRASDAEVAELDGFTARLGIDATPEARVDMLKRLRKTFDRLELGLDNNTQRNNFRESRARLMRHADSISGDHLNRQALNYRQASMEARIGASQESWTKAAGSEEGDIAKATMEADIAERGKLLGWGPEQVAQETLQRRAQGHSLIASGLLGLTGGSDAAAKYIQQNKAEIDTQTFQQLERAVRVATVADESKRFSTHAVRQATVRAQQKGLTLAQQEEYARQIAAESFKGQKISAEVSDQAERRIEQHYADARRKEAADDNSLFEQATQMLLTDPSMAPNDLPADMLEKVTRRGMLGELNAFQNSGKRYATDPVAWAEADRASPQSLSAMSDEEFVRKYRGRLSDGEFNALSARRAAAGKGPKSFDAASVVSINDRVERAARQIGILPERGEDATPEQVQALEDFRFAFDAKLQRAQTAGGKKASEEEIQKMLDAHIDNTKATRDEMVLATRFRGQLFPTMAPTFRETYVPAHELRGGEGAVVIEGKREYIRQVPAAVREAMTEDIIAAGQPATIEAIMRRWISKGRPQTVSER
jgi:hypothetical protein